MAFNVGALVAHLGFTVDDDGAAKFDKRVRGLREATDKPITQELKADLNQRDFELYERKLKEVRAQVARRDQFKAKLGADYDNRAFRAYERDLRRAESSAKDQIKVQGRLRTAFGSVYGRGGALFAAAGGLYGLQAAGKAVIGTASDINESLSKNKTLFGQYAGEVEKFSDTSAKSFGVSKQAALEYTGVFGNLFTALGVARKESAKYSTDLTKLAADMASFNNTSIEDALEAIRSGLVGETEPLRRFGVNLNDATLRQEAMSLGLTKTTKHVLTPYQKAMAAQALIVKQTDKAHGDFHRTQGGLANQTRILQARVSDLGAKIGEKLLPVALDLVKKTNKLVDEWERGVGTGGKLRDTVSDIGDAVKDVGGFVKDHIGLIKLAAEAWLGYKGAMIAVRTVARGKGLIDALTGAGQAAAGGAAGARAGAGGFRGAAGGVAGVAAGVLAVKTATDFLTDKSDLGLLDQYAGKLEKVIKLGDTKGMRELAKQLRDTAQANNDITKGKNLHAFADALEDTAKSGGKNLESLRDAFKRMAKSSGGDLERLRDEFADTKDKAQFNFDAVHKETRETSRQFRLMRRNTTGDMADIQDVVRRNTLRIKDRLGKDSDEGRQALANNFRQAAKAVRTQMRNGEVSTKEGMQAIRGYLTQELQVYGLSLRQARNILKGGGHGRQYGDPDANRGREGGASSAMGNQRGGRIGRQQGGWLGAKGMVGPDTIEIAPGYWAAPGEYYAKGPSGRGAVINRHQAPLVNLALMRGGYTLDSLPRDGSALPRIESALRDWGGLDAVFSAIRRPHMLQGGGWVTGDTDFLPGLGAALARMARAAGRRIFVQSGRRTLGEQQVLWDRYGHDPNRVARPSPNAPHVRGIAADISPGREVFGSMAPRFGLTFRLGNEPWHVELANAMGAMLPDAPRIPRSQIKGGGLVGSAVQRVLDLATGGAQHMLDSASMYMPGSDATGPSGGGWSKAQIARLWVRAGGDPALSNLMAAIALAESGGNPSIVNSIGATGLWQIHPGGPQYRDPLTNARTAVMKLRTQGLGAWEAYTNGNYRTFLQGGGNINVGSGNAPGHGRGHNRPRHHHHRPGAGGPTIGNLVGFAQFYEDQAALAAFNTPKNKADDLYWLRAAESTYVQLIRRLRRRDPSRAAGFLGPLEGVRAQIEELTAPAPPPDSAPTPETRPPTAEEIAQGVAGQIAAFNAARASLFSTYGSNLTLAGAALVPNTVTGQAAGLTNFGALTSGAGPAPAPARVINQTNVFPTPPPEPHLFARLTLHDLQAAP